MKLIVLTALLLFSPFTLLAQSTIKLATFRCDVTPPVGAALCGGCVKPVASVSEPLFAMGVVILGADKPIVLCAVDWCEIRGADHVRWCAELARAAGTTPDHVAVQSLHQHNAPIADSVAHKILAGTTAPLEVIDVAGAAEHCYFCYSWGWLAEYGTFDWYPEFDRPLGAPKGEATREGWTFRREFEHASVFVDVELKTAKIDWK